MQNRLYLHPEGDGRVVVGDSKIIKSIDSNGPNGYIGNMRINKTVAEYWLKNYTTTNPDTGCPHFCLLCGGKGSIRLVDRNDIPCICPNGQVMKQMKEQGTW